MVKFGIKNDHLMVLDDKLQFILNISRMLTQFIYSGAALNMVICDRFVTGLFQFFGFFCRSTLVFNSLNDREEEQLKKEKVKK